MLVKESRLQEVMNLLGSAGFDLYSSDPNLLTSRIVSPTLSPVSTDTSSVLDLVSDITPGSVAILSRTRSSTDASLISVASRSQPERVNSDSTIPATHESTQDASESRHARTKSHSPSSGEVSILTPDLACVGLSDEHSETWSIKIVKLVAFPELILPSPASDSSRSQSREWYAPREVQPVSETQPENPLFEPFATISTPPDRGRREASPSSSTSSSDEDGYFSHSPAANNSTSSLVSSAASRSFPDLSKSVKPSTMGHSFKPTSKRLIAPLSTIEPVPAPSPRARRESQSAQSVSATRRPRNAVGFFSFTRTAEGSSLTTDVAMLAALFPPAERHMVICSGELDAIDNPALEDEVEESDGISGGLLKCLQIDLRRFGLDKHGLVNRFSRVLEEGGINHMYSSTFKTANLLVEKAQATRAQDLLQSC
ncbi:hypothetical protein HWV62_32220 [Athelia sp. TMB]|nr:hypothetical protein HWV62_32220 [Athelia sp. TMB]